MQRGDRDRILNNLDRLCRLIKVDELIPLLRYKNVFNRAMIDEITSFPDHLMTEVLLRDITRRGPDAFEHLVDSLIETGYVEAAKLLKPELLLRRTPSAKNSLRVRTSKRILPRDERAKKNCYQTSDGAIRGYCLIVNNVDFDHDLHKRRAGSDADVRRLSAVFKELGYDVIERRNLTRDETLDFFRDYASREELTIDAHDSLVVIVMSHGYRGLVYSTDNREMKIIEDIVQPFNNDRCPRLVGVPKMFFIQACRGALYDRGINAGLDLNSYDAAGFDQSVENAQEEWSRPMVAYKKEGSYSDIIISYSTVEGYVSLRNEDTGSWYGTALAYVLMNHAHEMSLQGLLRKVNEEVQEKTNEDGHKQSPTYENIGFNKKFYFNPVIFQDRQLGVPIGSLDDQSDGGVDDEE